MGRRKERSGLRGAGTTKIRTVMYKTDGESADEDEKKKIK